MADGILTACVVVATVGLTVMVVAISGAITIGVCRLVMRHKGDDA